MLTADYKSPRSAAPKSIPANGAHQANGAGGSSSHQLHTPSGTSLKIKRDDLSPVSKFREEQKGMLLSVNTSNSSPSPYANVSNYKQHSGARQEIPISVRQSASIYDSQTQPKPRIQSTTTTINKTQFSTAKFNAYSATTSSNGHHYNNNYNNANPAVSYTPCGVSSQPYPSSKLDINYTYSEPATNTTTTTRISSFRLGYPDSDEDKIC